MKNTLIAIFLTMTFAFSSYADTKVLSVVTNGTEVITITETTNNGGYIIAGILYPDTVTTNVSVSTLPTPLTEEQKEVKMRIAKGEALAAKVYAFTPKKDWRTSQKEAYRNAYEFLSKPISKKEEK